MLSRLAYRKGIDLLVATAPRICATFPNVRFVVGGCLSIYDREIWVCQSRRRWSKIDWSSSDAWKVPLAGSDWVVGCRSPHRRAFGEYQIWEYLPLLNLKFPAKVLSRGSIFMNTSLTESFGIAILEAACTGLYVVSTRVGGVPEILPQDMISFAEPEADGMYSPVVGTQYLIHGPTCSHCVSGSQLSTWLLWQTFSVLSLKPSWSLQQENMIQKRPTNAWKLSMIGTKLPRGRKGCTRRSCIHVKWSLWSALKGMSVHHRVQSKWMLKYFRTMDLGPFAGPIYTIILLVDCVFFLALEWFYPREDLDYVEHHWNGDVLAEFIPVSAGRDVNE